MPSFSGLRRALDFGVVGVPRTAEGRAQFSELCAALSTRAGVYVIPHIAPSYRELANALTTGRVAFAWLPPLQLVELAERRFVVNLAIPVRHGSTSYFSALVVPREGAQSLVELRGKRVAWVDRDSAAGYVVPRQNLLAQGIDPDTFFASQAFLGSHDAVLDALLTDRADVGATYCLMNFQSVRQLTGAFTLPDGRPAKPVRVLKTIGPIASDSVVAGAHVDEEDQRAFRQALLSADGRTAELLFLLLRANAFRAADDGHYGPLRRLRDTTRPPPSR